MEFRVEYQHWFSEREYVELLGSLSREREKRWPRLVGLPLVGVACLFSPYTLLLGVALILVGATGAFLPRLYPMSAAGMFHRFRHLHEEVTYGVSHERLWVKSSDLSAEASWRHLSAWREHRGWLILTPNGIPIVFLPIDVLSSAGVYEEVSRLAKRYGKERSATE